MKGNDRSGDGKLTADGAERPTYVTVTWRRSEKETGQTLRIFWDDLQFDERGSPDGAQGTVTGRPHLYLFSLYHSVAVVLPRKAKYFKGGKDGDRTGSTLIATENEYHGRLKVFIYWSRTPTQLFLDRLTALTERQNQM